jgi:negative regulator of flagellin synthesis FlgM
MTDRINGLGPRPTEAGATRRTDVARSQDAAENTGAATSGGTSPAASDKVELTPSALLLQRLEGELRNLPEVDAERVRSFKEAIAAGEYAVDADRVAAKLARLDRELG